MNATRIVAVHFALAVWCQSWAMLRAEEVDGNLFPTQSGAALAFEPIEPAEEIPPGWPDEDEPLPPLEEELLLHGGSYLYEPPGDFIGGPVDCEHGYHQLLRLPECWQEPRPWEVIGTFLGADPIIPHPHRKWPGCGGYFWDTRLMVYGGYEIFGLAFEQDNQQQYGVGHQLLVDVDLRLTGTERFHVQYRPIGRMNTGGSFYQFSDPAGYIDNSTATPDRYWFEGEFHSIFGAHLDPLHVRDMHFVVGRFPFALQNTLLMNTELLGLAVNKNTIYFGNLSNMNVQLFAAREDIAAYTDANARIYGANISADYRHRFYELSYAYVQNDRDSSQDAQFAAISRTQFVGAWSFAVRALFKWGDEGGTGSGELFVVESNHTRCFTRKPLGIDYGVFYCNAFVATSGWRPISGGNFDRLRTSFEVDPLITISAGNPVSDNRGAAFGVQLFRRNEDESIIPEIAFQSPMDEPVWGFGLRYLRKTSARSFLQVLGTVNLSNDPQFQRNGIFVGETVLF